MKMSKYPSIDQFRTVIKQIKDSSSYVGKDEDGNPIFDITRKAPTLTFNGTVKLHGTNSSVCFTFGDYGNFWCQSRERIVTPQSDNAGFAAYVEYNREAYRKLFEKIENELYGTTDRNPLYYGAAIYGEWCGGNIQKGVGINGLPKMFVVFGIKLLAKDSEEKNEWLRDENVEVVIGNHPEINLYNIFQFGQHSIDIDFNRPDLSQNTLIDMTIAIEEECPVAKYFGVEGGTGEGLVFSCFHNNINYRFKCKGEKHSISKVRVLVPVDIERAKSMYELVDNIVSENRLLQGLDYLRSNNIDLDIVNTGKFIKWVNGDLIKEELDTIIGSGFEIKEVLGPASKKSKQWFFDQIFV
jgi:hypothetical protein